jgi:hypothetical protein
MENNQGKLYSNYIHKYGNISNGLERILSNSLCKYCRLAGSQGCIEMILFFYTLSQVEFIDIKRTQIEQNILELKFG